MQSLILQAATRLLTGLMLLFSVFLLLRGHNEPGGGFIGSLVASTAFVLYTISQGPEAVRQVLRFDPRMISVTGLVAALVAGMLPIFQGLPLFTGLWGNITIGEDAYIPFNTPLLFDIGVYLAVVGAVLTVILALEEEG